jgi:sugar lactone lactonase YvrE
LLLEYENVTDSSSQLAPHSVRHPERRRSRRRLWLAAVSLLCVAAILIWWRFMLPAREQALEAAWVSRVGVLAGTGRSAVNDGAAFAASFSDPFGVAAAQDGSIYVADAGEAQRVRRIRADGSVSTFAGGGLGYADGRGTSARFNTPSGIALTRDGILYVADTGNNAIRRITPDGMVSTVAGGLSPGYVDGDRAAARFNGPVGVAVDSSGRVIVADTYNDRIRAVQPDGTVVTVAGSVDPGYADGPAAAARFDTPCGVTVDRRGTIYVADSGNGLVRTISPDGIVNTVGPLPGDGLFRPIGIAATEQGIVYVTDDRGRLVEITPGVAVRVVAGSDPGFADGAGTDARFRSLAGVAILGPGRLVVADERNALIRLVAAQSKFEVRPPAPPEINPAFDTEAFAREPLLWPLEPMDGPFEVTGTLGEPRGGEGGERFHAGVDVHADQGAVVRSVRPGVVTSPLAAGEFGTLTESVRIGALAYVHVRVGRDRSDRVLDEARFVPTYEDGRMVRIRVRRGARFSTGEPVGTANAFNHVHLNVGWPGEEYNPLLFRLVQFEDDIAPTISKGGVRLFQEDGQPIAERRRGRLIVAGRVRVVVDAWDQVTGNEARRRLGLYTLGYQVLNRDGTPAPGFQRARETIHFDRLLPGSDAPRLIYAAGSGIPFYGRRSTRLLYVVTNTLAGGVASMGVWDTTELAPGDYTLRILAADAQGNLAAANRDVPVTIAPSPVPADLSRR